MLIDQFQLAVPSEINNNKEELLYLIGTFLYEMADNQFSFYNDCTHELEKCGTFREVMNLFRCIIQDWYDKPLDKESHSTAFQIKNYVDKNYYSDISLIALSEKLHLTPSYISRLFKKEFGINLFEYITEIRIQSAKDLLKSTDFKIYEIAERIGFKSTINFDYAFKRITGISPSKYRDN